MSDIKLEKDVMKNILILNNQTPRENNMYWITIEEMRDRLVHCGVDKALTTNMIGEALKKVNRGESFLTRRHEGKTPYYRPAIYSNESGTPNDQRIVLKGSKRLPITPQRDYFKSTEQTVNMLAMVNQALVQLDNDSHSQCKVRAAALRNQQNTAALTIQSAVREWQAQLRAEYWEWRCRQRTKMSHDIADNKCNSINNESDSSGLVDFEQCCSDDESIDEDDCSRYDNDELSDCYEFHLHLEPADFSHIVDDGYGIFNLRMMTEFITNLTRHAAQCSAPLEITSMDKRYGAGIDQYWTCCCCKERFRLRNCEWIRSVVQRGKGWSRLQPALNLELAMGARVNGINHEKLIGFLQGSVGIKTMSRRNQKHIDLKICGAILQIYEKRQEENLKEHVEACQQLPDMNQYISSTMVNGVRQHQVQRQWMVAECSGVMITK